MLTEFVIDEEAENHQPVRVDESRPSSAARVLAGILVSALVVVLVGGVWQAVTRPPVDLVFVVLLIVAVFGTVFFVAVAMWMPT